MSLKTRRTVLFTALITLSLLAVILVAVQIRRHSAPEAARLLPNSDAIVYFDVKTVRRLTGYNGGSPHDPEYQKVIDSTGFEPERDLDEVAVAVHSTPQHESRFSYIFIGHFDTTKVSSYLKSISANVERYRGQEVYEIPVENRTVRVSLLGMDMAAVSNMDDAGVLHGMIDRYKEIALPFGGPGLLQDYYHHVPLGSLGWGIVRIPPAPKDPKAARNLALPGGIDIFVPSSSTMVASIRILTAIDFKAEFFTASEADAKHFVDQAQTLLGLFQSIQTSAKLNGSDPDVKAVFDSFQFSQEKDRAILKANIPLSFVKKVFTEPPTVEAAPAQQPTPVPEQKPSPKKKAGVKK